VVVYYVYFPECLGSYLRIFSLSSLAPAFDTDV
jgi:hypothetical protein